MLAIRARTISVENIQRVVSEYFRIPLKELVGPKRTRIYARPRQLAMGLARELTGDSFPEIEWLLVDVTTVQSCMLAKK